MTIKYIDLTKVSNEVTLEVDNSALRVTTAGSSTTISGGVTILNTPLPVSGTVDISTSPIVVSGGITVVNTPLPVSGTVAISNNPVTVSGGITIVNTPLPVTGTVEISTSPITISGGITVINPASSPVPTSENWRASLQAEETANDSDKTFTVPAATEWEILSIWVELTTTATAGARQLEIQRQDSAGDVTGAFQVGVTQAASLTYNYFLGIAMPDMLSLRDASAGVGNLITPLPAGMILSAGEKIRIYDNNAVDAAADDMVIQMNIASRAV